MSTEDGYAYVPMEDGPGVYMPPSWVDDFRAICANNARLDREDTARAAAKAAQDGEPA